MILITGGAGFIGSNLVKAFNDAGRDDLVVCDDLTDATKTPNLADRTIADYLDVRELAQGLVGNSLKLPITAVCHQGACTDTMETNGQYMLENNYTFSKLLFDWATARKLPFVYASSAAVYGACTTFAENPENERPLNIYGYSKLLFDQYVRRHIEAIPSTVVGLRYFNVYGPREQHKGRMASMVHQLRKQVLETGTAKLFEGTEGYNNGEQKRDFIYVGDIVAINRFFLEAKQPIQGVFNAGTGKARSFNDLANAVLATLGHGHIEYIPFPAELTGKYQNFTQADPANLRAAGFQQPFTELEDGVRQTLK